MTQPPSRKVRPREVKTFLLNPHKGCETFQHFNGDPLFVAGSGVCHEVGPTEFPERRFEGVTPRYLPSTVAYCRWFWDAVEPEEGRIDLGLIERALETAAARGQTLHVRLMPFGAPKQPQLPKWYAAKYPAFERERYYGKYLEPDHSGPEYQEKWGALITEFGRRFDGDDRLECVDVSFLGPWGEGDGECSEEGVARMTKGYADAHPKTPLVTMISRRQMKAGLALGMGWRCDSCDDLGLWGDPAMGPQGRWNHLYDSYPWQVSEGGARDAWKTAPVAFEPGMTMRKDFEAGFDLDFIVRQDLKYHGSLISFKSYELPEEWSEKLLAFCNDLGYRFVLRQFRFDARVAAGAPVEWSAWIENVGVAPIYRRYDFAVRVTQGNRVCVFRSGDDIRRWLPGDAILDGTLTLPDGFRPGLAMIHVALVDPKSDVPKARFASEGADADGWLAMEPIEIKTTGEN
jgi:hypothetical protein